MLSSSADAWQAPILEASLWAAVAVGAIWRAVPSPRGSRLGWWMVAAIVAVFATDKLLDLYGLVYGLGRDAATALDPEHHLRGPNALYRNAALVVMFLAGCAVLWRWMRNDDQLGRGKLLCIGGIVIVGAIVTVRLVPTLQGVIPDTLMKVTEAIAWLLAASGTAIGNPKPPPPPRLQDGFL